MAVEQVHLFQCRFAIDAVGSLSGFTYVVENTSENYTLGFTNEGGRFDKNQKT